jgi:hypothetical protein
MAGPSSQAKEVIVVLTKIARWSQRVAALLLGTVGISVQISNVLICLALLFLRV